MSERLTNPYVTTTTKTNDDDDYDDGGVGMGVFSEVGDKWTNCRERERSRENVDFHDNKRNLRARESAESSVGRSFLVQLKYKIRKNLDFSETTKLRKNLI